MVEYGEFLLNVDGDGDVSERRATRAFRLFQSASERGDKTSHFYLGADAQAEAPNPKAALHHFTAADSARRTISESLLLRSQYELARCYLEGDGADQERRTPTNCNILISFDQFELFCHALRSLRSDHPPIAWRSYCHPIGRQSYLTSHTGPYRESPSADQG